MLDINADHQPDSESVPEIIPLPKLTKDWAKPRRFLNDKNQLETVLGRSNENWFNELSERAHLARKEPLKRQLPLFDSPVSSPTVTQLIKNHIQVGQSPPRFYHSSPASAVKNIHEYSLLGTPDSSDKWQRPSLGISPVLKDYPSYHGRSHVVAKLGLSHNDSTLLWTNSLATPPRLEDTNNESSTGTQPNYKDPVRALFSPSDTLDITGESLQALESTYEEDYDNSVIKHEDETQLVKPINDKENVTKIENSIENDCKHLKRIMEVKDENVLPSEMDMDTWRESFRRKLLVKSDSFGRIHSKESVSSPGRCDQNCSTPIKLVHPLDKIQLEPCADGIRKYYETNKSVQQVLKDPCSQISEGMTSPKQVMGIKECLSPVFPKPASLSKKVKRSSSVKRTREFTDNGVVEALSDFFDPPSGAVGKRHTPSLKRKSSEVGDIDIKQDISFSNDAFSTPKNVIISSILMKDKQTRSSSGKKVRFSESVMKYSEEKHANDSHTKKRRKTQNVPKHRNVERNGAIKIESIKKKSILNHEEFVNNSDIRTTVLSHKCDNSDKHKENNIEPLNEVKECEEDFSQISPTALEEMCNAAKSTCDKGDVKTPYLECPPNNSGDFSRKSDQKFMCPHTNMKHKRFLYPSKQQIVVASPGETFKFKTEEKGDAKSKGIVMAIQTNNIVKVKDIDQVNNKNKDEKMKNCISENSKKTEQKQVSNDKEIKNTALQKSVKYPDSGVKGSSLINRMKDEEAVGFQCASGKGINLSEVAVAKARILFEEPQCLVLDNKMQTPPNKGNKDVSKDVSFSEDIFNEEDIELADWCEDIDNDQVEIQVDTCLNRNVELNVEKEQTEKFSQNHDEVINQQGRTCTGKDEKVKIQSCQNFLCINEENIDGTAFEYSKGNQKIITSEMLDIEKNSCCSTHKTTPLQKDTHPFSGFTTASGHVHKFEEKELIKAKELLTFSDESFGSNNILNMERECFANKSKFCDKSTMQAVAGCSSHDFEKDKKVVKDFCGFTTASGKGLKLSTAAVKNAEILLLDNNNTKTEENMINKQIPIKDQTIATLHGRKHSLSLHDMFKEELSMGNLQQFGSDSLMDDELESLKTLKSKSDSNRNVKEITQLKVIKPCTKPPGNLDKPQGFRPFKAPKITLKKSDKYPPSVNANTVKEEVYLDKTSTSKPTVSDKNSFELDERHLLKNTKTKDEEENKQKENINYSESDLIIKKKNNEISHNDVCEGIFTQMFADDMDLDETPCQHTKNLEEDNKNIKRNSSVNHNTNYDNKHHNLAVSLQELQEPLDEEFISNATKVPAFADSTHELNLGQCLFGNKDVLSSVPLTQSEYSGFKTASGHKVVTSCEAIEKARQSFQEEETNASSKQILLQKPTEDSSLSVVSSKDSKHVIIQTERHCKNKVKCDTRDLNGLEASHVIVEEIDSSIRKNDLTAVSVKKDSNKSALVAECDNVSLPYNAIMKEFNEFCTANGENINISIHALSKGRKVLTGAENSSTERLHACIDSSILLCKEIKTTGVYVSDKENRSFNVECVPYNEATETMNNEKQKKQAKFVVFQTASGCRVPVSHEALGSAMKGFKDSDDLDISDKPLQIGFQTAKWTNVKESTKALEIVRKDLKNTEDDNKFHTEDIGCSSDCKSNGFQTASGTDIDVSATTLEITKGGFIDVDKTDDTDSSSKLVFSKILAIAGNNPKDGEDIGVFDKLQFIGLESASEACVELSDKAVEETKKAFKDTGDMGIPSKTTFHGFPTSETQSKILDGAIERANNEVGKTEYFVISSMSNGFQAASGTQAKVSNKTLERGTFKDDEDLVVTSKPVFNRFPTASGINVEVSNKTLEKGTFKDDEDLVVTSKPVFNGFQTASGINVKVSDKALEMARNTLKDNEDLVVPPKPVFMGFQTASGTHVKVSDKALEMARNTLKDNEESGLPSKPVFDGLQTASGTIVKVYDKALERTRNTLKDNEDLVVPTKPVFIGFQTASGANVKVSDEALEMARNTLKDNEDLDLAAKPVFIGFQTASGTHVKVSDKALKMARNTLKDNEDLVFPAKPVFNGFQTASGTHVKVSDKTLEMARNTLKDNEDLVVPAKPVFDGFQTASGTHVKVSDKALEMARNNLKDNEDLVVPAKPVFDGFQTASGTHVKVSDKALEMARNTLKDNEDLVVPVKPVFDGFQTASGTHVKVSDKALEMARNTLKDNEDLVVPVKPVFDGFQTASGTHVKVSDKALEMARNSLKDNEDLVVPVKPVFDGFQTASGTHVKVSDKALEMARNTLKDNEELVVPVKPVFDGFQTASGTHVKVSDKALEMARNSLKDNEDLVVPVKPVFDGFQTASGTHVKVSDKALEMARNTLKDNEDLVVHAKPVFDGFQTASGTNVKVSKKALEMARNSSNDTDLMTGKDTDLKGIHRHQVTYMRMPQHEPQEVHMEGITSKDTNLKSSSLSEVREADVSADQEGELPFKRQKLGHGVEKGITHIPGMKPDMLLKRKPLRSAPEGMTTDRRHPGFRPFKPVRSRNIEKHTQRKDESSITALTSTDCRSSFQTPYKKADQSKETSDVNPESKFEINMKVPVFQRKSKSGVSSCGSNLDGRDTVVHGESNLHQQTDCDIHDDRLDSITAGTIQSSRSLVCDKDGRPSVCTGAKQFEVSSKMHVQIHDNYDNDQSNVKISCDKADVSMETNDLGSISQDEDDMFFCNLVEARRQQDEIIASRKSKKVEPVIGRWYKSKMTGFGDRLELKDVVTRHFKKPPKVKPISVTSITAEEYRFSLVDHYGKHTAHVLLGDGAFLVPDDEGKAGKKEFYRAFLTMEGVDPKLINEVWVFNHYRWIVWKLAAYEVTCASLIGRSLTPENVMLQIKYRYDREIDRSERSCLKRIYERDDAASKRLVLCVSSIRFDTKTSPSESRATVKQECIMVDIELTDGWYKVPAQLDGPLTTMVHAGRISVGQKLCISGAELVGSEDACLPLEAPASIHLKININSTRLAAWDSPLGYQRDPRPLCVPLVSLFDEGGIVGVVDVVLVRKYPIMYMEKLSGGGCVFRSSRDEEREQQRYQTKRQIEIEKLYNQIQVEIENEQRQDKRQKRGCKKYSNSEIEAMMTGDEIHEAMENAARPDMVENYLSATQQGLLYEYQRRLQDEKQQELNIRVQSALRDCEEEAPTERNVTPVLKFRIAGCSNKDLDSQTTTILTVWRPAPEISELQEGKRYKIYSLNTSSARSKYIGSSVQVTATKQTKFMHFNIDENLLDRIYEAREVLWVNDIKRRQAPYGELDFVGYIVKKVSAEMKNSVRSPDILYIADCQSNILCVKFWNGFKMFGEDMITEGSCVCMSNLMDKSSYRNKTLPAVEATTEFTTITLKPQNSRQRQALEKLCTVIKNKDTFKDDLFSTLDDLLQNRYLARTPEKLHEQVHAECPNQSPVKVQDKIVPNTGVNPILLKDEEQLQVAVTQNRDIGDIAKHLDESFTATPSSQSRSKNTQSRLAKLAAYSTPDCISPLPVVIPRSVSKDFKPPAFRKKLN